MNPNPLPTPVLPPSAERHSWRPIRFAGRRDRKLRAWLPFSTKLQGSALGSANMVRIAIRDRVEATRRDQEATRLMQIDGCLNKRHVARNLTLARIAREQMRHAALWARLFAQHLAGNDPRLELLRKRQSERLQMSWRAMIWSDRWMKVQEVRARAAHNDEMKARCIKVLRLIAAKHDALTPHGHMLGEYLDS